MVAASPVLHLHGVRRLNARREPKRATTCSGASAPSVPLRVGNPPQGDDPLLLSSGPAGILGALNQHGGEGFTTEAIASATVTECYVDQPQSEGL